MVPAERIELPTFGLQTAGWMVTDGEAQTQAPKTVLIRYLL